MSYMDNLGAGNAATRIYRMLKKRINVDFYVKKNFLSGHNQFIMQNIKQKIHENSFDIFNYFSNKLINNNFCPQPYKSLGWYYSPYPEIINRSRYDIVQLHWINNFLSIKDISRIKKKIIWRFSDMWPFLGIKHYSQENDNMNFLYNYLENINKNKKKKLWKNKINIIAPSLWLKNQVERSEITREWPVETIYTPVDINTFKPLKASSKKNQLKNSIIFGADNLNDERKGLKDILNLFKLNLINKNQEFNLLLFGRGEVREKKINNLNIFNFGHQSSGRDINKLLNLAEVMILPSKIDNLPQIGLEAQTSGLPIILYKNSGMAELIEDNKTGYFVKDQNLKSLAETIEFFFKKKENEKKFIKDCCRSRSLKNWSEEIILKKYENLYKMVLND